MSGIQDRINFSILTDPDCIEVQEVQGQKNFVNSSALPIDANWDALQRWGIVQGAPMDDLFCSCTLPEGWKKVPMEESRGSRLVDSRGLIRAHIFFKAAFYDRSAHLSILKRFTLSSVDKAEDPIYGQHSQVYDHALHRVVFIGTPVLVGLCDRKLVAVQGDTVYSMKKKFFLTSTLALRANEKLKSSDITFLTEREFFRDWHNRQRTEYPFIKAVEELGNVECKDYLNALPTDDSIWGDEFDFPEVVV